MARARAEVTIDVPADRVWARIRDFGEISWTPGVESCTLDGDDRTIRMQRGGFELVERLLAYDDANRTYTFCLVGELDLSGIYGPGSIAKDLEATLAVTPAGDSAALVTWDVEAHDFMINGVHAEYQNAIGSLKAELEG